jgi:hypothetical protein
LKNSFLIISFGLICGALSGCNSIPLKEPPTPETAVAPNADEQAASKQGFSYAELTDEIFFKVVSAEIAFQRGDFPTAFATTVSVAQQTQDARLAKRALEMALIAKQPVQAYLAARLWYEYAPNSDEAAQYYVGFLVLNNSWEEVKEIIAPRLAAAQPKERGTMLLQTERVLMRSNDKVAAFRVLEELCKPYPDDLSVHLALAQGAYASKNNERALKEAYAALRMDPSSQIAAISIAQASPTPDAALKALIKSASRFFSQEPSST